MTAAISALIICAALGEVKTEMAASYPAFRAQIAQVAMPSVGYRNHLWFNLRALRFQAGRCDLFRKPQIIVVKGKDSSITAARLKHEISHYIAFAAGLPMEANERIDGK
jgi:hypothetical protein